MEARLVHDLGDFFLDGTLERDFKGCHITALEEDCGARATWKTLVWSSRTETRVGVMAVMPSAWK